MKSLVALLFCLACAVVGAAQPTPPPLPAHDHEPTEQPSRLDQLGADPGRRQWGPLAVLRGHDELLPAMKHAASAPEPLTRQRAMFVLGQLALPEALPLLRQGLRDEDKLTRLQAGVGLTTSGQPSGLAAATVALQYAPEWLRLYALRAMWQLDTPASRKALADSRDYLTPFLQETLSAALRSRPAKASAAAVAPLQPLQALTLHEQWLNVADLFVEESDFWWHKGNYEQCIRCQETALFFDPNYVDLYSNIAWLQWSLGRHGQAISTYRRGIAANPHSWEAHHALGHYYILRKQPSLALPHLQKAANLGSPAVPRRQLGHVLEQLNQRAAANQVWRDILKLDPNDPIARRQLERQ